MQRQLLAPRRNQGDYGMTDSLTPELIEKIVASLQPLTPAAAAMIVPGDLEPRRLGPEPPPGPSPRSQETVWKKSILSAYTALPPGADLSQNRYRDRNA